MIYEYGDKVLIRSFLQNGHIMEVWRGVLETMKMYR